MHYPPTQATFGTKTKDKNKTQKTINGPYQKAGGEHMSSLMVMCCYVLLNINHLNPSSPLNILTVIQKRQPKYKT